MATEEDKRRAENKILGGLADVGVSGLQAAVTPYGHGIGTLVDMARGGVAEATGGTLRDPSAATTALTPSGTRQRFVRGVGDIVGGVQQVKRNVRGGLASLVGAELPTAPGTGLPTNMPQAVAQNTAALPEPASAPAPAPAPAPALTRPELPDLPNGINPAPGHAWVVPNPGPVPTIPQPPREDAAGVGFGTGPYNRPVPSGPANSIPSSLGALQFGEGVRPQEPAARQGPFVAQIGGWHTDPRADPGSNSYNPLFVRQNLRRDELKVAQMQAASPALAAQIAAEGGVQREQLAGQAKLQDRLLANMGSANVADITGRYGVEGRAVTGDATRDAATTRAQGTTDAARIRAEGSYAERMAQILADAQGPEGQKATTQAALQRLQLETATYIQHGATMERQALAQLAQAKQAYDSDPSQIDAYVAAQEKLAQVQEGRAAAAAANAAAKQGQTPIGPVITDERDAVVGVYGPGGLDTTPAQAVMMQRERQQRIAAARAAGVPDEEILRIMFDPQFAQ